MREVWILVYEYEPDWGITSELNVAAFSDLPTLRQLRRAIAKNERTPQYKLNHILENTDKQVEPGWKVRLDGDLEEYYLERLEVQ